jgi:hypothetical protein
MEGKKMFKAGSPFFMNTLISSETCFRYTAGKVVFLFFWLFDTGSV